MEILFNYEYGQKDLEELSLLELAAFVLEHENKPAECEVSISFVEDDHIARLNKKYRHKDGPTDVLSFECDGYSADDYDFPQSDADDYTLGDVVIAPDVAKRQMAEYGTTFEEEISLLLVHGLLHLCGYDHIEDDEAKQMEELEAKLLKAWKKTQVS